MVLGGGGGAVKEGLKNTFSDEKKNVKLSFNCSDVCCHRPCYRRKMKEMFYLTTHSTHFIYGNMAWDTLTRRYRDGVGGSEGGFEKCI